MAEGNTMQEFRRNRFLFEIEGVDLYPWLVSKVAYCGGKIVVTYREIKGLFTSEFFDNNGKNIVGKNATLRFLDAEGKTIGEARFTGVSFEQMQIDTLTYESDEPLQNTVYFIYKNVKHHSVV
ncbi:MAG: hypothetical protein J6Y37_10360 [Paludibacteraceae bacterium]|nr:hypothetical protein [Paludibacteraceae bacterium]